MNTPVRIVRLGHAGDGVTEDGRFIPYTVPGDTVRLPEGAAAEIIVAGSDRVAPVCAHFGRCGGCALQHVARPAYLDFKRQLVAGALKHRGFADPPVAATMTVGPATRRRATFKAARHDDTTLFGFHAPKSHAIVDIGECPILVPELLALVPQLREMCAALLNVGEKAELHVTATANGADVALTAKRRFTATQLREAAGFAGRLRFARLTVNGDIAAQLAPPVVRFAEIDVEIPPGAFLQPTAAGEELLRRLVLAWTSGARRIADLFCGCGTFALPLARDASVTAADSDAAMIAALTATARRTSGLKYVAPQVRDLFRSPLAAEELAAFDAVVLDPPRTGAKTQSAMLAHSRVPLIVYVSCNAASFARDARILADGGYRLAEAVPVDQFLWTPHVELAARFVLV